MRIKAPELQIDPNDPFKTDRLGRRESTEVLTELLKSLDGPFVLSVNSTWGTGKTTFVKMWEQHLRNEGFNCPYFNAWECDFACDPLIPLIGEVESAIVSGLGDEESRAREYFEKAKKVGGVVLRRALPAAAKIATAGLLDLDEFAEKALADLAGKFAQEGIDSYEADKKTLEQFRRHLGDFALELAKDGEKPLVFFIDELDRCRPPYALELLERVKHLFSVPGIVFVLVLDKEQIAHSIRALYGAGMDVDGYLRRFIDLDYQLPEASIKDFCTHLFLQFGFAEFFGSRRDGHIDGEQLLEVFIGLAEVFGFSLRVQEQCFTRFSLALRTTPDGQFLNPAFLAFLIALKAANHRLYDRFVREEASPQEVLRFVADQPNGRGFLDGNDGTLIEAYVVSAHLDWRDKDDVVAQYIARREEKSLDEKQRQRYGDVARIIDGLSKRYRYRVIDHLARRIELAERFTQHSPA